MKNVYEKLFEFRKLTGKVVKSANNPFFKSKYSTLPDVIDATDPALEEVGLVYLDRIDGDVLVSEVIDPESGETISSKTTLMLNKQDMQQYISAVTYARRVARMTLLGLMSVDDDGSLASGKSFIKPAQVKKITQLALETGTDLSMLLSHYGVPMLKDMLEDTAKDAIKTLELKKQKGVKNGTN